jgi:hypothetical protein
MSKAIAATATHFVLDRRVVGSLCFRSVTPLLISSTGLPSIFVTACMQEPGRTISKPAGPLVTAIFHNLL